MFSLAPPSFLSGCLVILGLGVVVVVILRPVEGIVPAQHLPAQIDKDLVHICYTHVSMVRRGGKGKSSERTPRPCAGLIIRSLPSL